MRKVCVFALVLCVGVAGAPASVLAAPVMVTSAQADPGKLVGVLKDAAGKPLQNATVNVMNQAGQVVGTAVTDANGLFSVANLPAGNYSIQAVNSVGQALAGSSAVSVAAGTTTTVAATASATGIAVATGSAGFISALGGPVVAAALVAGGVVGAVAIQKALDDASPSR